jgi:hypothetical protein
MATVAAVYTASAIVDPIKELFAEILPGCRLINIVDDSLIQDVIREGFVTPAVSQRLFYYYSAARETGAQVIFNTCSSVGEVADLARKFFDKSMSPWPPKRFKLPRRSASWPHCRQPWLLQSGWSRLKLLKQANRSTWLKGLLKGPLRPFSQRIQKSTTSSFLKQPKHWSVA